MMSLSPTVRLSGYPAPERQRREELLNTFAELVIEKPLSALQKAKAELERSPTVNPPIDPAVAADSHETMAAWTRNLMRVFEDRARLMEESLPSDAVRVGLGISRQRLHQMVKEGALVAVLVQDRRSSYYPSWQFTGEGTLVAGLERVIAAAREIEMDAETLHFFMAEPNDRLGHEPPANLLARGDVDQIVNGLRSTGLGRF